jgi:hypothetical protein
MPIKKTPRFLWARRKLSKVSCARRKVSIFAGKFFAGNFQNSEKRMTGEGCASME